MEIKYSNETEVLFIKCNNLPIGETDSNIKESIIRYGR